MRGLAELLGPIDPRQQTRPNIVAGTPRKDAKGGKELSASLLPNHTAVAALGRPRRNILMDI